MKKTFSKVYTHSMSWHRKGQLWKHNDSWYRFDSVLTRWGIVAVWIDYSVFASRTIAQTQFVAIVGGKRHQMTINRSDLSDKSIMIHAGKFIKSVILKKVIY